MEELYGPQRVKKWDNQRVIVGHSHPDAVTRYPRIIDVGDIFIYFIARIRVYTGSLFLDANS